MLERQAVLQASTAHLAIARPLLPVHDGVDVCCFPGGRAAEDGGAACMPLRAPLPPLGGPQLWGRPPIPRAMSGVGT